MFCHVKFICDNEKSIVPASFIRDFNIADYDSSANKTYEVFWSPNPEDTPLSLIKKQTKILVIDQQVESSQRKRSLAPLPGYYLAYVLMIADSEAELESTLNSKGGRKLLSKTEKDVSQRKQKDKKIAENIKLGKRKTTEMLFNNKLRSVFSDSDSDDSVIPQKIHDDKVNGLEKENKKLKTKNENLKVEIKNLKSKYEELQTLNIALQRKLLKSFSPMQEESLSLSENRSPLSENGKVVSLDESSDSSFKLPPAVQEMEEHALSEPAPLQAKEWNIQGEFSLDEEHLSRVILRVKPGQTGDSLFVKNLACAVFGEEILQMSSVTGTKCNAKRDSIARPGLCPMKLNYIKKLLENRIQKEIPPCTEEEKKKRLSKLNSFIAEKIATLARKK